MKTYYMMIVMVLDLNVHLLCDDTDDDSFKCAMSTFFLKRTIDKSDTHETKYCEKDKTD